MFTHGRTPPRRAWGGPAVVGVVAAAVLSLAACSGASSTAPSGTDANPASGPAAAAATGSTTVKGTATDSDGKPVADVIVGFASPTDPSVEPVMTTTGAKGTYQLTLAPGVYAVSCVSPMGNCAAVPADGADPSELTIGPAAIEVDMAVEG